MAEHERSFETEVLVALERIEGRVNLVDSKLDTTVKRLDSHEEEIGAMRRLVYKGVGVAAAVAILGPMVVVNVQT